MEKNLGDKNGRMDEVKQNVERDGKYIFIST